MHLQLAPRQISISKQWNVLLWMQTLVLNLLPEERILWYMSWGIDCIPPESSGVGNSATDFISGRTLLPWGLLQSHTYECARAEAGSGPWKPFGEKQAGTQLVRVSTQGAFINFRCCSMSIFKNQYIF